MGFDLSGAGGALYLNRSGWSRCLRVAHAFGWEPEGTEEPKLTIYDPDGGLVALTGGTGVKWDGGYFTNNYQGVTDADAKALAAALDRATTALETGAELSAEQHEALKDKGDCPPISTEVHAQLLSTLEMLGLPPPLSDIEILKKLARYARQGPFVIG